MRRTIVLVTAMVLMFAMGVTPANALAHTRPTDVQIAAAMKADPVAVARGEAVVRQVIGDIEGIRLASDHATVVYRPDKNKPPKKISVDYSPAVAAVRDRTAPSSDLSTLLLELLVVFAIGRYLMVAFGRGQAPQSLKPDRIGRWQVTPR